jgi:hypothetical protein
MLGDAVHEALTRVGITRQRVKRWIGECCCEERRRRLNALDAWARRVVRGRIIRAVEYLHEITGE